jgi:hypothetical protein
LLHGLLGLSVMTVTRRMVEGPRPRPAAVVLAKFRIARHPLTILNWTPSNFWELQPDEPQVEHFEVMRRTFKLFLGNTMRLIRLLNSSF